jgi:hypothetical protein
MDKKMDAERAGDAAQLASALPKLTLSKETVMNLTIRSNIRAGLPPLTQASKADACCA